jgi:hypothetical protein
MKIDRDVFAQRISESSNILTTLHEDTIANSMIALLVHGLVLVQTNLEDDMPLYCSLVRVKTSSLTFDWYYVIPAEHI